MEPRPSPPRPSPEQLHVRIAAALASPSATLLGERLREPEALARFYAARDQQPAWLDARGAVSQDAPALLRSVERSWRHGLRPGAYHAAALRGLLDAPPVDVGDAAHRAVLDILLSDAFLHLARHLSRGAVDPRSLHPGYRRTGPAPPDPSHELAEALETGRVAETLAGLAPPHPEYAALVQALERVRTSARTDDPTAGQLAGQLRINLERWRWLPRDLGDRHLRVAMPDYTLKAFRAGEPVFSTRVVVGDVEWKTPLVNGIISRLVLNPTWRVPWSIATREMLPSAQRDPAYFEKTGIQVLRKEGGELREVDSRAVDWQAITPETFRFQLRQPPGPDNPLGPVKFVFPNPYAVYLHGTPTHVAFSRPLRTLSHGCVRVEDELPLAAFALAPDPEWTEARLQQLVDEGSEQRVPLPVPLPVYLLYFTASVDPAGRVVFSGDPYGWDPALLEALAREPVRS